jgi:hypothetical protein
VLEEKGVDLDVYDATLMSLVYEIFASPPENKKYVDVSNESFAFA